MLLFSALHSSGMIAGGPGTEIKRKNIRKRCRWLSEIGSVPVMNEFMWNLITMRIWTDTGETGEKTTAN